MLKVLIINGHPIVREGLKACIKEEMAGWVGLEAANAADALRLAAKQRFKLFVLDLLLEGRGGLEFVADLHRAYPRIPILILSIGSEEQYAARSLRAGAAGYIGKGVDRQELIRAIHTVLSGDRYISPWIAQRIALEKVLPTGGGLLSNREYEILRGIAAGRTLTDIAREMVLSIKTVSTYKRRIMGKLGVSNNAELIRHAVDDRVLDEIETTTGREPETSSTPRRGPAQDEDDPFTAH
jgi:two-component system invasion response regulator UvrY